MTYHLSHTDLDGYSCQYLTSIAFEKIEYFNSGYGKQIDENFKTILNKIKKNDLLLITDLNLTADQSEYIDKASTLMGFKLLLLDHHGTGKPSAEKYDWYNLDVSKCATMITYEYYKEHFNKAIEYLVSCVNAYDIYLEDDKLFNFGKTMNGLLMSNRRIFPKVLLNEERKILFKIIEDSAFILNLTKDVVEAERGIYDTLRTYLSEGVSNPETLPFDTLKSQFLYNPIVDNEMFDVIEIEGRKVEVYFDMGDIFQEFSHLRLEKSDLDIALNIGLMGNISMRASNNTDITVDKIAQKYFNGGGHPKASGGRVDKGEYKRLDREKALEILRETTSS